MPHLSGEIGEGFDRACALVLLSTMTTYVHTCICIMHTDIFKRGFKLQSGHVSMPS